jgi:hypothetical protein
MSMDTGTNFYPRIWVQVRISTHGYEYGYEFLPTASLLMDR